MSSENKKSNAITPPNAVINPSIQVIKVGSKPENSINSKASEPSSGSVSSDSESIDDVKSVDTSDVESDVESVASSKSSSGSDSDKDSDNESDKDSDISASTASTTSTVNKLSSDPLFFVLSQFLMNDNGNIVDALNNIDTTLKAMNKNLTALKKYQKNIDKETKHKTHKSHHK